MPPRVVVVMPAYNAAGTLEKTWREVVAHPVVDLIIVVDDASQDATFEMARKLDKVVAHAHPTNRGYGANQKTCYRLALEQGADIVVMVHPDYQYTPRLIPVMVELVASGFIRACWRREFSAAARWRAACRSGGTSPTVR
jgi:glycosyltransferase involved in cell wall biosynthesis